MLKKVTILMLLYFKPFRLNLRLFSSLFINAIFISVNVIFAIVYRDIFPLLSGIYYTVLAFLRLFLFRSSRITGFKTKAKSIALTVGFLLIVLDFTMASLMLSSLFSGNVKIFSKLTLIPQIVFSLFCVIGAAIRITRMRRRERVFLYADVISFSAALFSIFNLLLFLDHSGLLVFERHILYMVGAVFFSLVFALAAFIITATDKWHTEDDQ